MALPRKKENNSAQSADGPDIIAENQPDPQPGPSSSANSGCTSGHIAPSSDVTIGSEDDDGPVEVEGEVPVLDQVAILANQPMHTHKYDIGNYLGKMVDDHTKRMLLQSPWILEELVFYPALNKPPNLKQKRNNKILKMKSKIKLGIEDAYTSNVALEIRNNAWPQRRNLTGLHTP